MRHLFRPHFSLCNSQQGSFFTAAVVCIQNFPLNTTFVFAFLETLMQFEEKSVSIYYQNICSRSRLIMSGFEKLGFLLIFIYKSPLPYSPASASLRRAVPLLTFSPPLPLWEEGTHEQTWGPPHHSPSPSLDTLHKVWLTNGTGYVPNSPHNWLVGLCLNSQEVAALLNNCPEQPHWNNADIRISMLESNLD